MNTWWRWRHMKVVWKVKVPPAELRDRMGGGDGGKIKWKLSEVDTRLVALFKKLSHDTIFTMCSHTFTLFWLRKTSVIVKIYKISFPVFVYALPQEISSCFGKFFLFLFLFFVISNIFLELKKNLKEMRQLWNKLDTAQYHQNDKWFI